MVVLCVRAVTLPGAGEGLEFYLIPDFGKLFAGDAATGPRSARRCTRPWARRSSRCRWASRAMAIFGSYIGKERRLTGEAVQHRRCWTPSWRSWRA